MGYLTPDTVPDKVKCRALFVPDSEAYLAIVRGALEELTFASSWTKFGTLTQEEAAASFVDMFDKFCLEWSACRMIGELVTYAGSVSPNANWLVCDGSQVNQADYPDLYTVIGDTYGAADTGNFRLPDLCGRTPAGSGAGSGLSPISVGQKYGEQSHTLTVAEMPSHSHSDTGHMHSTGNSLTFLALTGEEPVLMPNPIPASTGIASANLSNTGDGGAHNTIGPRIGVLYLIVAKDG